MFCPRLGPPKALRLLLPLAWAAAGCGGAPATTAGVEDPSEGTAEDTPGMLLPDGDTRLPAGTTPLRYRLDLRIDPAADTTRGTVEIDVHLDTPVSDLRLHGEHVTVTQASAAAAGRPHIAAVVMGPNGGLALRFSEPLPSGDATLRLQFQTPLAEVPDGVYRVHEGDAWYAFSQFEPLAARQAFPCFDEPGFKVPFAVTLRVPEGLKAFTNTPETGRRTEAGFQVITFAPTPPLPTYLLALAVGPFDVSEAPPGTTSVPVRLISTAHTAPQAAYTLSQVPRIIAELERFFGRPVPYSKLDLVAVPNFAAGAMENPGLVTFRERLLLLDENAPTSARVGMFGVVSHELSHLWFGDLVTMRWWDDLWLNEAFATWSATRTVQAIEPGFESDVEAAAHAGGAMSLDAQPSARTIRQPIRDGGDVENAFDGITYGKGALVLGMLQAWLGPDTFRDGVRAYLHTHENGNATTADLSAALATAAGADPKARDVARVVDDFTTQVGTPFIRVELACAPSAPAVLALFQTRYRPAGVKTPDAGPWTVPMCVRYALPGATAPARQCFTFSGATASVPLDTPGCPVWLHPNADEHGYYRWTLPDAARGALFEHLDALSLRERVALPGIVGAWLESGTLAVGPATDLYLRLASDTHRLTIEGAAGGLRTAFRLLGETPEPRFSALVQAALGPHLQALGLAPKPGEPADVRLLRNTLVASLSDMTEPADLADEARNVAAAFLRSPTGVDAEQAALYVPLAANRGDLALWQRMVETLKRGQPPIQREILIRALGSFRDPALLKRSLELVLDDTLRAQDLRTVQGGAGGRVLTRRAAWDWVAARYDQIAAREGDKVAAGLPSTGAGFCTAADRQEIADFFAVPGHDPQGTARNLSLTLESIDRCVAFRARHEGGAKLWLENRRP